MTSIDRKMAKLNVKFNLRCMLCIQLINSMKSRYTIRWLRTLSIFWFMAKVYMLSEPSLMWVFIWFCISQCNEHSNFGTWFSLHIFISQINNNRAVETSNCGCNPFMTLTKLVHKHMLCAYDSARFLVFDEIINIHLMIYGCVKKSGAFQKWYLLKNAKHYYSTARSDPHEVVRE